MPKGVYTRKPYVPRICGQCGRSFSVPACYAKRGQYRYCGRACYDTSRAPAPKSPRPSFAERIWQKIVRGNGCWEWTGTRYPNGYGSCASGKRGRNDYAHRVVWRLTFGRIPDGLRVLHHCDNPPCCRPDHLFLGTDADNVADKVAKGRQLKGEQITGARLRATQIPDIRQRLAEGEPMHLIAADCGVSRGAIQDIALNKTWRHVV
jgi:hypothetical protein